MHDANVYLWVKLLHQLSVALSLSLFAARWAGVLAGKAWPMTPAARRISVLIDVVLLCAGITLWVVGQWHPWHNPWLGTKMVLLVVYVVLGSWALKRATTRAGHTVWGLLALLVAGHMVGVALNHHPSGWCVACV